MCGGTGSQCEGQTDELEDGRGFSNFLEVLVSQFTASQPIIVPTATVVLFAEWRKNAALASITFS